MIIKVQPSNECDFYISFINAFKRKNRFIIYGWDVLDGGWGIKRYFSKFTIRVIAIYLRRAYALLDVYVVEKMMVYLGVCGRVPATMPSQERHAAPRAVTAN